MDTSRISRWPIRLIAIAIVMATAGVVASSPVSPWTAIATHGDVENCFQGTKTRQSDPESCTRALEAGAAPQGQLLLARAQGHYRSGNFAQAQRDARAAADLLPTNRYAIAMQGWALHQQDPASPDALLLMARSALDTPTNSLWRQHLRHSLRAAGGADNPIFDMTANEAPLRDVLDWELMGLLTDDGDYPGAASVLHRLVDADPDSQLAASSFLNICMNDEVVCERLSEARAPQPRVCPGDGSVLDVIPSGLGLTFPEDPAERIAYEADFIADGRAFALIGSSYVGAAIAFTAKMSPDAADLLLTFDPFVACTWAAFQTSPLYTPDTAEFPVMFPEVERTNMAYLAQIVLDVENGRE